MSSTSNWQRTPPAAGPAHDACLRERGSLSERLIATGHAFAVTVLAQGAAPVHDDEADALDLPAGATLYARHVVLTLDEVPVVTARSITRPDCATWRPILERGRQSLGLALFGGVPGITQEPLAYRDIMPGHPLYDLARRHDPTGAGLYHARRARFVLANAPLIVCEVFLPALETFWR